MDTTDPSEDARLLRRYVEEGSEAAFVSLVQRHLGLVYSAALRQLGGDRHQAEDMTQGVFTELARQARKLARHPTLTGWLYTTTHHLVSRLMRGEKRRVHREQEAHAMQELDREPPPDWHRLRPVIDEAMRDLREPDRVAVLLRYFEGRDLRSIGAAMGVSEDAARMRVDRALDRLRSALGRRGITATAGALSISLGAHAVEILPAGRLAGSVAVSAVANAGAAGAVVGVVGMFTQAQTQIVAMKIPVLTASLASALFAVPLVIQHQRVQATQAEVENLRLQAALLEDLRSENEKLRALAAMAQELDQLRQGDQELARLRAETELLRAAGDSPLHMALVRAEADQRAAEAQRAETEATVEFRQKHEQVVDVMKHLGLAARIYASDHQDRLPRTFEEFADIVGDKLAAGAFLEDFEFYPQPRVITEVEPQLFLFREKRPRQRPDGRWVRGYTLVDGSVQSVESSIEDFSLVEQQYQGIASAEVPEALRDHPAYRQTPQE